MGHERADASIICAALGRAGVSLPASEVRAERRDERWLVRTAPPGRIAITTFRTSCTMVTGWG